MATSATKTKKLSHLQIFIKTVIFEILVIAGPVAISTRAVETTENYCPRETKMKAAKRDEQKRFI